MGLGYAFIRIECDTPNCDSAEELPLTALAKRGSWDERNVQREARALGWRIEPGGTTRCPDCCAWGDAYLDAVAQRSEIGQ